MIPRHIPRHHADADRAFIEAVDAAEAIRVATPGLRYRHTLKAAPVGVLSMQRRLSRLLVCAGQAPLPEAV